MKTVTFYVAGLLCLLATRLTAQEKTPQEKFNKDLDSKHLTLYILGGIASKANSVSDKVFQKKYNITYYDFGCLATINIKFYEDYNLLVLLYLTEKVDYEWKKEIRKDILGWEEWQKKK